MKYIIDFIEASDFFIDWLLSWRYQGAFFFFLVGKCGLAFI
ncbi:MAG: hypothetical protein OXH00_16900 [Candidatus Poribacteria bacterium]|nr:hypothetical protein [Candidatus Poribacteria bacterium]